MNDLSVSSLDNHPKLALPQPLPLLVVLHADCTGSAGMNADDPTGRADPVESHVHYGRLICEMLHQENVICA